MQSFPAGDSNTSSAQNSTSEDVSEQAMLMVEDETDDALKVDDSTRSPYWISVSKKSGFRRMHLRDGCGVLWFRCKTVEHIWNLKEAKADAVCKDCARKMDPTIADTSSSGSSSSEPDVPTRPEVFDIASLPDEDQYYQDLNPVTNGGAASNSGSVQMVQSAPSLDALEFDS